MFHRFLSMFKKSHQEENPSLIRGIVLYECRSAAHSECPKAFKSMNGFVLYTCMCKCHGLSESHKGGLR